MSIFCLTITFIAAIIPCRGYFMPQKQNPISFSAAVDDDGFGKTINSVFIFSISSKVYWDETLLWGYGYKWEREWICDNLIGLSPNNNMMVFPNGWMDDRSNQKKCEWLTTNIETKCRETYSLKTMLLLQDFDSYEPIRDFNRRLLLKVLNALVTECYQSNVKYQIIFYINFAEKSLATDFPGIQKNNSGLIKSIHIVPMSVAAANYYYRAINPPKNGVFYFFDRFINEQNQFMKLMNRNWHQIYILGLTSNLTNFQFDKIIAMDSYFSLPVANRTEPISFMIVSKQQLYANTAVYQFCENEHFAMEECYKYFRLEKETNFEGELIDYKNELILRMVNKAIQNYYGKIFGAQLPPEQMADAIIHKEIQPKPRIVLITDYVEMKFLNSTLPNENGFEFKVYALNKVVAEHFQGRADVVIQMDPDNPPIIPFTREEEEFSYPTIATPIEEKANSSIKTSFIVSTAFGFAAAIILLVWAIILYRRKLSRLDWLHRLEQFKTQHLFDAYMNEKRKSGKEKEKAADCWEIDWNQILLTNEQLGKGAFGEVRKATLPSFEASNFPNHLEIAVKMLPIYASENTRKNFLHEMKIMKMLGNGHQCVVKMLGCMSKGEGALGIVLEFCAQGSLLDYLNKSKIAEGEERQKLCRPFSRWAWQIADGMVFLAGKNLVHRDLAARNVLLDENLIAKISDFGLCISLDDNFKKESEEIHEKYEKLPIFLLAPECLERRQFSEKSDVWAFGLLLHEIYTFGTNPFLGIEFDKLLNYIWEYRLKRPELCPELIYEIMQKCLLLDFIERPTFIKIKEKLTRILEKETVPYGYMDLCIPE